MLQRSLGTESSLSNMAIMEQISQIHNITKTNKEGLLPIEIYTDVGRILIIAELLLKMALNTKNQINQNHLFYRPMWLHFKHHTLFYSYTPLITE